jgi:gamma-D-glutamyl-L-lysine dipeptidyl-peptidase
MTRVATVTAPVATLWTRPEAPRPGLDAAALGPHSDPMSWVAGLDDAGRMYTGVLTQLLHGEPVLVEEVVGEWARVVATAQPAGKLDPRGYPGWLPMDQLTDTPQVATADAAAQADPLAALQQARGLIGVPYVWGGMTAYGIDCSGLVHLAFRQIGVTLPRDADDQAAATFELPLGTERPGDLYFFGRPGRAVHHVGFVAAIPDGAQRRMLHACGEAGLVVEELMTSNRTETLVSAHRVL